MSIRNLIPLSLISWNLLVFSLSGCGLQIFKDSHSSRSDSQTNGADQGSSDKNEKDEDSESDDHVAFVEICTASEFAKIKDNLAGKYKVTCDIDFQGINFITIAGADPTLDIFTGILDGDGHVLQNINFTPANGRFSGIIAVNGGTIRNIKIKNAKIISAGQRFSGGCLVGHNGYHDSPRFDPLIENIEVDGCDIQHDPSQAQQNIGGVAGRNVGKILGAKVKVTMKVKGSNIGGVVGSGSGILESIGAEVDIETTDSRCIGGIIGGFQYSDRTEGRSASDVLAWHLTKSTATGSIKTLGNTTSAGGAVGCMEGATARTNGTHIMRLDDVKTNVAVMGADSVGGLVGRASNECEIANSAASNIISGSTNLGGIAGSATGCRINNTTTDATVRLDVIQANNNVGGFIGYMSGGSIARSSAKGTVDTEKAILNDGAGGFVGNLSYPGASISDSYADVDMRTLGNTVGGFVGLISSGPDQITNLIRVHSQSRISVLESHPGSVGAVVGKVVNSNVVHDGVFWNSDVSFATNASGGNALTAAQSANAASYTGWDFSSVWQIPSGGDFPALRP